MKTIYSFTENEIRENLHIYNMDILTSQIRAFPEVAAKVFIKLMSSDINGLRAEILSGVYEDLDAPIYPEDESMDVLVREVAYVTLPVEVTEHIESNPEDVTIVIEMSDNTTQLVYPGTSICI